MSGINIYCEATGLCVILEREILLMESGFANSGKDGNELKSEGPLSSQSSEYVPSETQLIMDQVPLHCTHVSTN
jgi:hypothetical protein